MIYYLIKCNGICLHNCLSRYVGTYRDTNIVRYYL